MKSRLSFHSNSVWPPFFLVAVFAAAYAMLEGGLWLIGRTTTNLQGQLDSMPEIIKVRAFILGAAAGFYALFRLWRFHPACNLSYASWLKSTPWTPAKPLPLGPVHWVWQDLAVVGVLTAIAQWHARIDPALPLIAFGMTFLIGMYLLLALTRTWLPCLVLGFLWPALGLPLMRGPAALSVLGPIIVVTWYGHRKSLWAFPWRGGGSADSAPGRPERAKSLLETQIRVPGDAPSVRSQNLGWPLMWLSPRLGNDPVRFSTSVALSALFGWWAYCFIISAEMPPSPGVALLLGIFAALIRLATYCAGVSPPFNLWGRLASGRIIVPGFDQVLVTPLVVIALATAGGVAIRHAGAWYPGVTACLVALIWLALLGGGPSRRRWELTGQHRYRPPTKLGNNKQTLRPI